MNFYCAYSVVSSIIEVGICSSELFHQINKYLPRDCIIVNEGSTTMDIGRTVLLSHLPRQRYRSQYIHVV